MTLRSKIGQEIVYCMLATRVDLYTVKNWDCENMGLAEIKVITIYMWGLYYTMKSADKESITKKEILNSSLFMCIFKLTWWIFENCKNQRNNNLSEKVKQFMCSYAI